MKPYLFRKMFVAFLIAIIFLSCKKENPRTSSITYPLGTGANNPPPTVYNLLPVNNTPILCDSNRPIIKATLIPVGYLSVGRMGLVSATAGSKIVFAGGMKPGAYSPRVDIYDTITKTWSSAELSIKERQGMAVAVIGNKVFFAGGQDADWIDVTSRIDIYDASTNSWSTAELSYPRAYLSAVTLKNKVFFAGGANWSGGYFSGSEMVDIYDNSTNTWTASPALSVGRYELSATTVGNKIYFAGGLYNINGISSTIDIYDIETDTWSGSHLQEPRAGHVGISSGNKILFAGGAKTSYSSGYQLSNSVEIEDLTTGTSLLECITPKAQFNAGYKNDNIVFFTGNAGSGTQFDIYNTVTHKWSVATLDIQITNAAMLSVNNIIYVAGGRGDNPWGPYYDQVWRLEF